MAERKNFSGDRVAAFDYLGAARQSLMILKNDMSFNKLLTGSRTLDLPEGVRVYVACVFGQDTIDINVPPGTAVEALVRRQVQEEGRTIDAVPIESEYQSAFIKFDFTDNAFCNDRGILAMTKTLPAPAYRIYICGGVGNTLDEYSDSREYPVLWSTVSGWHPLGLRSSLFRPEKSGWAYAISADGAWVAGYVKEFDSTAGGGRYLKRACVWKNPMGADSNVVKWDSANNSNSGVATRYSIACAIDGSTIRGNILYGFASGAEGLRWNGNDRSYPTGGQTQVAIPQVNVTRFSADRRVEVDGAGKAGYYRLDGGPWIKYSQNGNFQSMAVVGIQDPTPSPITTSISF